MNKIVKVAPETKQKINGFLEWFIYMIGYAIVLIAASLLFKKTFYIDSQYYGLWGLILAIVLYLLNKTIKPVLDWMTIPLNGKTLGLFHFVTIVLILKIADFILQGHFNIKGFWMPLLIAILISLMNIAMEQLIIKPLTRRLKKK